MIDNTQTWKSRIEMIIPKLSASCFVARAIKPFVKQDTLKMVYYAHFHLLINYGVIFWRNCTYSNSVFKLQKRIIRIIIRIGIRDSCRVFFRILNILWQISQYIFSLVLCVVNNENQFRVNCEIHDINAMNNSNFSQPLSHLNIYQKGLFYMGI